jgi:hypothetical protein
MRDVEMTFLLHSSSDVKLTNQRAVYWDDESLALEVTCALTVNIVMVPWSDHSQHSFISIEPRQALGDGQHLHPDDPASCRGIHTLSLRGQRDSRR